VSTVCANFYPTTKKVKVENSEQCINIQDEVTKTDSFEPRRRIVLLNEVEGPGCALKSSSNPREKLAC
jgi:hypothetical protein